MKGGALFDLSGRTALVTGGGSGLGLGLARGLAEAGARVVLNGRDAGKLAATRAQLAEDGHDIGVAAFDVADANAVRAAVADIERRFGPVDILVNNAGITRRGPIESLADDDWRAVLATNLDAPFFLARAVVPAMKRRGAGKIINVASVTSTLARPAIVPYATSKGGVAMLTRSLAVELAKFNIQANAIAPGYFKTELTAPLQADADFDEWVCKRTPAGRWGTPDELGGAAVFLASRASDYVTGQILYVDGGFTAGM